MALYMLIILTYSCSISPLQQQTDCSDDSIHKLRNMAWDEKNNNNQQLARDNFEKMCECGSIEGCLNASIFYDENDVKAHLLQERACDLEDGNTCFHLGEKSEGSVAKKYYEKGCSFSFPKSDQHACRMAAQLNIANIDKAASYYEKGCLLGDITACIEAYKIIKDPKRKKRIMKASCEIGVPEVCRK